MTENLQAFLVGLYKQRDNLLLATTNTVSTNDLILLPDYETQGSKYKMYPLVPAPGAGLALQLVDFLVTTDGYITVLNGTGISLYPPGPADNLNLVSAAGFGQMDPTVIYKPDRTTTSVYDTFSVTAENTSIYLLMGSDPSYPIPTDTTILYWFTYRIVPVRTFSYS